MNKSQFLIGCLIFTFVYGLFTESNLKDIVKRMFYVTTGCLIAYEIISPCT